MAQRIGLQTTPCPLPIRSWNSGGSAGRAWASLVVWLLLPACTGFGAGAGNPAVGLPRAEAGQPLSPAEIRAFEERRLARELAPIRAPSRPVDPPAQARSEPGQALRDSGPARQSAPPPSTEDLERRLERDGLRRERRAARRALERISGRGALRLQ